MIIGFIVMAILVGLLLGIVVVLIIHCYRQYEVIESLQKPFLVLTSPGTEIVRDDRGNIVHIYIVGRN